MINEESLGQQIKQLLEQVRELRSEKDGPCRNCGRCPTCGRSGYEVAPWVVPTYPVYPYWPPVWYSTSAGVTISGNLTPVETTP